MTYPGAFRSHRIMRTRLGFVEFANEREQVIGARQSVVHERARQQLPAIGIVQAMLMQGLADPLCNTAVQLTLDDHRIDHRPEVVHRPIADNGHFPCFGIDLDLTKVGAVAESEV